MEELTGKMFNNELYSDVILQVGEQTFFAHRLVLSSWSDVFKTMLCNPTWQPNQEAASSGESSGQLAMHQELLEEEACAKVFEDFLKFMYTSSVSITTDNALPLIRLADKYLVVELRNLCDKFLTDVRQDLEATISLLSASARAGMATEYEACIHGLRTNFNRLTTEQIERFDAEILVSLLDSGFDLVVDDEHTVFKKIEPWLEGCEDDNIFVQIIKLIRFSYMKASQLNKLTTSSEVYKRALTLIPDMCHNVWQMKSLYSEGSLCDISQEFPFPRLYLDMGRQQVDPKFFKTAQIISHMNPMPITHTNHTRWVCSNVDGKMFFVMLDKTGYTPGDSRNTIAVGDSRNSIAVFAAVQEENVEITITPDKPKCCKYHVALEAKQGSLPCQYFSWIQSPTVKTDSLGNRTFSWKPVKAPALSALQDPLSRPEIRLRVVLIEEDAEEADCLKEAHDEKGSEEEVKAEEDGEEDETESHRLFGSESHDDIDDNDEYDDYDDYDDYDEYSGFYRDDFDPLLY